MHKQCKPKVKFKKLNIKKKKLNVRNENMKTPWQREQT